MSYVVKFQTEPEYKNIKYGQGTVYSSACGPASLCNVLYTLGIANVSVPTMCSYAVSVGARVEGGTDEQTLLKHASQKYGFTYKTTSKNADLLAHLNAGGAAILHGGNSYKLFSNSGHFVAAVAASGQTITVLDSYWYGGKYTSTSLRANNVKVVSKGVIQTSLTQCGKATIDRSPSYYLISKKQSQTFQGVDTKDMTDEQVYALIEEAANKIAKKNVSDWAAPSWKSATNNGIVDGTSPRSPLTREQFTVIGAKIGLIPTDKEPSDWAASAWKAATDAGIVDGTNPHGVLTREMLVQILNHLGFVGNK